MPCCQRCTRPLDLLPARAPALKRRHLSDRGSSNDRLPASRATASIFNPLHPPGAAAALQIAGSAATREIPSCSEKRIRFMLNQLGCRGSQAIFALVRAVSSRKNLRVTIQSKANFGGSCTISTEELFPKRADLGQKFVEKFGAIDQSLSVRDEPGQLHRKAKVVRYAIVPSFPG